MIERLYIIEDADAETFFGVNRSNLLLLGNLFPKLKIRIQKNVIKILGEAQDTEELMCFLQVLEQHCCQYNQLSEEDILSLLRGREDSKPISHLILYGVGGKPIVARGENQQRLVSKFEQKGLCFAVGPAGSGKTFIAISLAVKALKSKQVRRIILSRPAVEAGEKIGFLPGEMKDKLDPYLQPLYDALGEMIPAVKLRELMDNGTIQIAPLGFMRGRTLNDAVIILDEAQNTTSQQMKMFLTRMGMGSKMIVTGDMTQIDLPKGVKSGLRDALHILNDITDIGFIEFEKKDIVRHPLIQMIVDAYDNATFAKNELSHSEVSQTNNIITQ